MKRLAFVTSCLLAAGPGLAPAARGQGPASPANHPAPVGVSPGAAGEFLAAAACPTFHWAAVDGAPGYELVVYAADDEAAAPALRATLPAGALGWTPPADHCLAPGGRYAWSVRARDGAGRGGAWSEALLFTAARELPDLATVLEVVRRHLAGNPRAAAEVVAALTTPAPAAPGAAAGDRAGVGAGLTAALHGEAADTSGEAYGLHAVTQSPDGAGARLENAGGGPDLVLGGATDARLSEAGLTVDAASDHVLDLANAGTGALILQVDGVPVVTTATDQDALGNLSCADGEIAKSTAGVWGCALDAGIAYSAGNQLALDGTTFNVLEGPASGLDADTLDGLDSTAFLPAGTDLWVDEAGDAMSGLLLLDPAAGIALQTGAGDAVDLGGDLFKGGTLFLHDHGANNTALGAEALAANTSGTGNTAVGRLALGANTSGYRNVAVGYQALGNNTDGTRNVAVGSYSLQANDIGHRNTALGHAALYSNTGGLRNVAVGGLALFSNTTGSRNTAIGTAALSENDTGMNNTAVGAGALLYNTTGARNAALGQYALAYNTTGNENTAAGPHALYSNTVGADNAALGADALLYNQSGDANTAIGREALRNNVTGSSNIAFGRSAGVNTTGSSNIVIGNPGLAGESGAIRIGTPGIQGSAFLAGVHGVAPGGPALPVVVEPDGKLGTSAGSGSGIDADLLDGLDSTAFLPAGTDLWVDAAGDTMGGTLDMAGNALQDVGDVALQGGSTVSKAGVRFLWDDGALGSLGLGRGALESNTTGDTNTAIGENALRLNTSGQANTAVGWAALDGNTQGHRNTALGREALLSNTASDNTAVGFAALKLNSSGTGNTAVGQEALAVNTTGYGNTAVGGNALIDNTTGFDNTAVGHNAGSANTTGRLNAAVGAFALTANTTGRYNTAIGGNALRANTLGNDNTAVGEEALAGNTDGNLNAALGQASLLANTIGSQNTAAGSFAMYDNTTGNQNTALGHDALRSNTSGSSNVALGYRAGFNATNGDNNVFIANEGVAGDGGTIRIGTAGTHAATLIAGISGVTTGGPAEPVLVDASGQLGTAGAGGVGLDADTLDGLDSTAFMPAGTDLWVDAAGDAMGGTLDMAGNALAGVGALTVSGNATFDNQVDLRGVTVIGDSTGDQATVAATFQLQPRSAAPACSPATAGTVYFDSDDATFCFCEGVWRPLDGVGACT